MQKLNPFDPGPRNSAAGLAHRAMKNLAHIERAYAAGADVHVVTQVIMSLQEIVVFPWEHGELKGKSQEDISVSCGAWLPLKTDTYTGRCTTLRVLLRHVRNALSHRRLEFSSDSRDIEDVVITFSDRFRDKTTGPCRNGQQRYAVTL